jgi:hypothetical protein
MNTTPSAPESNPAKFVIGRHLDGITINPYEYVLDMKDELIVFASEALALDFLQEQCVMTREQYEDEGIFILPVPDVFN